MLNCEEPAWSLTSTRLPFLPYLVPPLGSRIGGLGVISRTSPDVRLTAQNSLYTPPSESYWGAEVKNTSPDAAQHGAGQYSRLREKPVPRVATMTCEPDG